MDSPSTRRSKPVRRWQAGISKVLGRIGHVISTHIAPLNFITLHYSYFIGLCLLTSVIFWGVATPFRSLTYTDSLFFTVSAMSLAGLNTVNLSQLNTVQQVMLFILIMLGSAILVSSVVVNVRRKAFEARFRGAIQEEASRQRAERGADGLRRRLSFGRSTSRTRSENEPRRRSLSLDPNQSSTVQEKSIVTEGSPELLRERASRDVEAASDARDNAVPVKSDDGADHITFDVDTRFNVNGELSSPKRRRSQLFSNQGIGVPSGPVHHKYGLNRLSRTRSLRPNDVESTDDGMFPRGKIGRNSTFHNMSLAEREKLGGVEYKALTVLRTIVPLYFVLFQLLGSLGIGAYVAHNKADLTRQNGLNPWWVGAFNAISAFNNSGMSLLDANMVPFQSSYYMLITMGLLILAGNTCYPVFLRLIIWTMRRLLPFTPYAQEWTGTFQFLLDHPRRCYTNLFPAPHTWWLLFSIVALNGIDTVAFVVLNIGNKAISLPGKLHFIDGLFQALAVRSGGFYVVSIASVRIGLQVLYVIMMYISVFPVVITMRNSNVYEERSLGIYADDTSSPATGPTERRPAFFHGLKRRLTGGPGGPAVTPSYFVSQQLRAQLAHDLWWIVLAVLFICITEAGPFERDPVTYSVFNVIFEVVSAYGCVGISVGLPNQAYSFSGGWHVLSKLILCAVMIRGRHRGLPVAIDRAVLLPGEHLAAAEEEDALIRLEQQSSRAPEA